MGFKIIQLLLSAFIISLFLGIGWNIVRGFIDGYMDRWEEKYLVGNNSDNNVEDEEEE